MSNLSSELLVKAMMMYDYPKIYESHIHVPFHTLVQRPAQHWSWCFNLEWLGYLVTGAENIKQCIWKWCMHRCYKISTLSTSIMNSSDWTCLQQLLILAFVHTFCSFTLIRSLILVLICHLLDYQSSSLLSCLYFIQHQSFLYYLKILVKYINTY